jgi:hypothetical protein
VLEHPELTLPCTSFRRGVLVLFEESNEEQQLLKPNVSVHKEESQNEVHHSDRKTRKRQNKLDPNRMALYRT